MTISTKTRSISIFSACLIIFSLSHILNAGAENEVMEVIDYAADTNQAAVNSQTTIDKLDGQTRQLLEQYRALLRKSNSFEIYREQLKKNINAQKDEKKALEQQLLDIEQTHREITPLMLRMIDAIEEFITFDIPFLPEERRDRIARLRKIMEQPGVTISERYQYVLEAYQIENDYGRTIEAYRAEMDNKGVKRTVNFLRIGRTSLYYQTLDGRESGYWDSEDCVWTVLPARYRRAIQQGLRIARKQAPPTLLELPVQAPEEIK